MVINQVINQQDNQQNNNQKYILALDLGTTGNRAFVFDNQTQVIGSAYKELTQYYPQPGWLEHDAVQIWEDTQEVIKAACAIANITPQQITALGLTNQRETCLLWDKTTGQPLHKAIVWQDRRTADVCEELHQQGYTKPVSDRTGLIIDAYFSATKLRWLLQHIPNINLDNTLAGTIDTWILWQLTGGKVHATDHTNASRTMLMNLHTCTWDKYLLDLFAIPAQILPQIQPSLSNFGVTAPHLFDAEIPITAILGDQQASLFGHGCDRAGMMKCTYGTGSFLVANTGTQIIDSQQKLIATVGWTQAKAAKYDHQFKPIYALEGSIFTSGACIQWLRDSLQLIDSASESETLATQVPDSNGVYFVPALSGLGAPHWDTNARGAFLGITAGVTRSHIVRAVLEAIAFQVCEVVEVISRSSLTPLQKLAVDGGACNNNFLMQFQADILGIPVERPVMHDTTVQGAAFAAGISAGLWESHSQLVQNRQIDRVFTPGAGREQALVSYQTWQKAVERAKDWV